MINKIIVITILKLDIARFIVCWLIIDGEYCKWIYALQNNESFTQYHCFLIVLFWNTSFLQYENVQASEGMSAKMTLFPSTAHDLSEGAKVSAMVTVHFFNRLCLQTRRAF